MWGVDWAIINALSSIKGHQMTSEDGFHLRGEETASLETDVAEAETSPDPRY